MCTIRIYLCECVKIMQIVKVNVHVTKYIKVKYI